MPDTPGSAMDQPRQSLWCFWKICLRAVFPWQKKHEMQERMPGQEGLLSRGKEKHEAHLDKRRREQEMPRKGGETGEMQGLEGVSEPGQE